MRAVYRLHADLSYDVRKSGIQGQDIVALRTTGGIGKVKIDGCGEITATPGTLLFFAHDKVRRYFCPEECWDFWWFEFSSGELQGLPMNRLLEVEPAENEAGDCDSCLQLLGRPNPGMARLASATFSLLLCKWMMHIEYGGQQSPHRQAVESAINHMKAHGNEPVSIEFLARMAGLSERRFRQVFINVTGMQPKKYQEAHKMRMAEELLLNTPCTIYEISMRLGYSSQFHFCKAFRNAHGIPPSQFRADKF